MDSRNPADTSNRGVIRNLQLAGSRKNIVFMNNLKQARDGQGASFPTIKEQVSQEISQAYNTPLEPAFAVTESAGQVTELTGGND